MKKIILLLFFTLVYSQEGISQNTFFIGEKMYPCTETFTLTSNSKNYTGYIPARYTNELQSLPDWRTDVTTRKSISLSIVTFIPNVNYYWILIPPSMICSVPVR